jgi:hypothetical protein
MAIILTVLGFMWSWHVGLVILGLLIARRVFGFGRQPMYAGEGAMFGWDHGKDRMGRKMARMQEKMERMSARMSRGGGFGPTSSGNHAFDEYRAETLKRLEDEQREFKDFLERLRFAKDRAEFDQFMSARRQAPFTPGAQPEAPSGEPRY